MEVYAADIFGKVNNPAPIGSNPTSDLGNLFAAILLLTFTIAGIVALIYMMWGAINWITSGGDKERLMKAQGRIRNAIIGIFVLIAVLAAFVTLFQFVLGGSILRFEDGAIQFDLPTLGPGSGGSGDGSINCPPGTVANGGACIPIRGGQLPP